MTQSTPPKQQGRTEDTQDRRLKKQAMLSRTTFWEGQSSNLVRRQTQAKAKAISLQKKLGTTTH
jgi:hypothetical protein